MYCDQCGQFWEVCTCDDEPHLTTEPDDTLPPIENVFEQLQPYQKEVLASFDYGETERRVLVLMGGFNAGRASFIKVAESLKHTMLIIDEAHEEKQALCLGMDFGYSDHSIQALIKYDAERRLTFENIKDLPRVDRPHYRTLEKKNKKSRYK